MDAYLETFFQPFQHLQIQLEEIKSATDTFNSKNCIGVGGFGKVYKGELSHYKGRSMVAIKRLDKSNGQGTPEFLKEITTLSRYSHENLISLLGFCYEGEEMILVYEHASRGSFDRYLNSPHLTWSQRIKICLDAAKGLSYLHDPSETHQRLIHCDIKSGNILLDDQWNAKLSDLGLSIVGSANEQQSVIVTLAAGTLGYIDPQYMMTNTLTKESDVYSFGVVLFEVLCGLLCYTRAQKILVRGWIESYKQQKLNDIIFKSPTIQPLDQSSLEIFLDIAYRCLNEAREDRPMMTEVVTELENALETQEFSERNVLFDYEEMAKTAEPPINYRSKFELLKLLSEGVLVNKGKTWFSLNKKGEHCEMISFAECLVSGPGEFWAGSYSRFAVGSYYLYREENYKVRVKTQFLSLGITYTVNITFEKSDSKACPHAHIDIKYKSEGETETSTSNLLYESDDGCFWICELYQFTSKKRDHEILFEFDAYTESGVVGIEFRPLEEVELTIDEKQPVSDSDDANWEENLPDDYEYLIKESKDSMHWATKKEAYSILRKGFLINDGKEWISLDNNGKKYCMLSARAIFGRNKGPGIIQSVPESRFGVAVLYDRGIPSIGYDIGSELLSFETKYVNYLIYKLPEDTINDMKAPVLARREYRGEDSHWFFYIASPQTPVFKPRADENTHNPLNMPKIKGVPRKRDDVWMEVQIGEFLMTSY